MDREKLINALNIIYESGLDTEKWQDVGRSIADLIGNDFKFAMQGHDFLLEKNIDLVTENYDEDYIESYKSYYAGTNVWLPYLNRVPVGQIVAASDIFPRNELFKTEFWNDWLKPQGPLDEGVGAILYKEKNRMLALTSNYSYDKSDLYEPIGREVLRILSPHIRRAFDLQRVLHGKQLADKNYLAILNVVDKPILLLDRKARISFANIAAEEVLRTSKLIYLKSDKTIGVYDNYADQKFERFFDEMKINPFQYLDNPIKAVTKDDGTYYQIDLKLFNPNIETTGFFTDFFIEQMPSIILSLNGPYQHRLTLEMKLRHEYKLTPAEIKLAVAFLNGAPLPIYADSNKISINTVRNQMRSIMSKLNCNRQAEMIILLSNV